MIKLIPTLHSTNYEFGSVVSLSYAPSDVAAQALISTSGERREEKKRNKWRVKYGREEK